MPGMKKLAVSTLLALGGTSVSAQKTNSEIMVDQPAINDGIIFNQGGETHQVSYLDREFSEDDVNVTCSANNMCIQLKKSFLAEEGITTNYDGIHLKNCEQEQCPERIKVTLHITFYSRPNQIFGQLKGPT